jgi:predicted unusual protein kinase regulating ubiquinone biosynthesis (AarF/ABC1/UbiB family)
MTEEHRDLPDSVGARMRRYARVSAHMGGLAARLAGERYLGVPIDRRRHAEELRRALGGLKGPLMKVAQLLSTIPEALPAEYAGELAQLQADAPSMGWLFVRRRMANELGDDWQSKFTEFERTAARAASLGQVHRARAQDGRALACKLQYPDMRAAVDADLAQLKLIFAVYRRYDPTIDPGEIHAEIAARLHEELDYVREARHIRLYAAMLAREEGVHVPEVVDALSTRRLLTMTWLEGRPLMAFTDAAPETRNAIAHHLFRAWYVPFYDYGVIHGDPHLGNYTVREDNGINLLDYGCIRIFEGRFIKGVIDLYRALRDGDEELAVEAYRSWGFRDLSREVIDVLNLWAEYVYSPLLEDRARRIQDGRTGHYGHEVAETVHRELRRLGGVRPPREFVFVDRAAIGLGSVFMHLRAEINWHRLFEGLIGGFDAAALDRRQKRACAKAGLSPAE